MIEFENVSFSYTGQEHGGLHDINLKISDGECVLFCGRSGCGKTTITRLVNGLIPQFYQGNLHGRVLVDGQEISNIPMYQIAAKVGSVFQNPRTQFFNVDTDSEIAFGIENEARPPKKLAERVEQTTEDLHIQKLRNRNIFELSGGEKQKIAFASVYAMNPQIYKVGDLAKNFALSLMLIVFVMTFYVPAGIILMIADLLLIPGLWISFRMVRKYGKEKNDICAENVSSIVEYVSGIQTFRAYGVGGMKNKTVINAMREFCRISFVYEAKVLPIGASFGILSWLSCPLVILLAYAPWVAGTLNTVDYLLICMLPLFCAKLANSIFVDLTSYKNLMISKNKILGVMNEPEETGSMEPLHTATHEITFDNVDFSYVPGEPVLKHATFTVPDQKLTAIVGDSGSGKSTILNLIAKYYEATNGTISIGGKAINHVAAERVLEQVSMVDQDVFLFDDTIRDNIRHARPNATDAEIEAACREANCDSFIRKMEKGYDTPTGENGNLLSGGERQRISIARAILKNSPILLLDEATASLDIENELAVKQAIANLLKEKKTVVMIAHTLSIVKNADQILVMGDGGITESGTHEELLAKGGKYAAMWNAEQKISA